MKSSLCVARRSRRNTSPAGSIGLLRALLLIALLLIPGRAYAAPMTFGIVSNGRHYTQCTWIAADGDITPETAKSFDLFLQAYKDHPSLLVINSTGGELEGGIELGNAIRANNLAVYVGKTTEVESSGGKRVKVQSFHGGDCASACVFALMGGVVRGVSDSSSTVRIHQFRPADESH